MRSPFLGDNDAIVRRVPETVWQKLQGSRLFLTGGTGWFGRNLLETVAHANALLGTGIEVVVLSRDPARFAKAAPHLAGAPGMALHAGDVRDFSFPSGHFSHVLHAATTSAQETSAGEPPLAKFDTLVGGTRRVLDFARACGASNLLFTSSGVAGAQPPDGGPIREDYPGAPATTDPATALGQGKRAAEFLCSCYGEQYGWNTSIARCFSFVGPYMPLDLHYAIGNFIGAALSNRPIVVKGDGSPVRSYLYTGDLVVWLLTLLAREGRPRIYNVGSDQGISIGALAGLVRDALNPALEVRILGQAGLSIGNPLRSFYVPNIDRARAELALEVWTNPGTALQLTAAHASARELQSSNC
jgi:dTDP-glucose 4,6-dehydratase/UDP-glucose 4-epimerase